MKRGVIAAGGCYALLALALFAPAFFGGRLFFPLHTESALPWRTEVADERLADHQARANPELSDKLFLIEPGASIAAAAWRQGELPTWNPAIVGGTPSLGLALDGSLYPPNAVLLWISPLERAYAWAVALHVILAGLGTFVLARRLGLADGPALLAGLLFAAGGPLVVQFHLHMRFFAAVWVPWLLAAVHAFTERATLLRWCAIPPPIALVVLSGFPQTGLYGILGAAGFGAVRLIAARRGRSLLPLIALGGAFALGGALSAAQLLPVDDASKHALPRAHDAAQQIRESGTRWMLAGYLVPGAFQDARAPWSQDVLQNPLWNALYCATEKKPDGEVTPSGTAARPSMTEGCCYLGALGLLLALAALLGRPGRGATPLAFGLLVALALCWAYALGDPLVVRAVGWLPRTDVGEVRRIVSTIGLLGALLAAVGAQRLLDPEARGARRRTLAVAALLTLLLFAAFLVVDRAGPVGLASWFHDRQVARYGPALVERHAAEITPTPEVSEVIQRFVRGGLLASAGWFAAALAVLYASHRLVEARRARAAALVLLVAAAADLAALHFRVNPFVPAAGFLAEDPLLAPLAASASGGRVHRFAPGFAFGHDPIDELVLPPDLGACFGIEDAEGYLVRMPTRYARYLRALEPEQAPGQTVVTVAALPLRTTAALRSPLLDGLAVKHVLTRVDLEALLREERSGGAAAGDDASFRLVAQRGDVRIYENVEALPFALVVPEACLLPPAPADDSISVAADAVAPDSAAVDRPDALDRLALHRAALRALSSRPGLLRQRVFLEAAPPQRGNEADPDFETSTIGLAVDDGGNDAGSTRGATVLLVKTRGPTASVVSLERSATRITVHLDGRGGGFLLVNEGFDPGWTATIDGTPAPVVPANVAFRGVVLPPGARSVVLDYKPRAVKLGFELSAGALALLLAALLISGALARRPASPRLPAAPAG